MTTPIKVGSQTSAHQLAQMAARDKNTAGYVEQQGTFTKNLYMRKAGESPISSDNVNNYRDAKKTVRNAVTKLVGKKAAKRIFNKALSEKSEQRIKVIDEKRSIRRNKTHKGKQPLSKDNLNTILKRAFAEKVKQYEKAPDWQKFGWAGRVGGATSMTLQKVMADPILYEMFYNFAQCEFAAENINFLDEVRQFEQMVDCPNPDLQAAREKVKSIVNEFCRTNCSQQINIDSNKIKEFDSVTDNQIDNMDIGGLCKLLGAGDSKAGPKQVIISLLDKDTMGRFQKLFSPRKEQRFTGAPTFLALKSLASGLNDTEHVRLNKRKGVTRVYARPNFVARKFMNVLTVFHTNHKKAHFYDGLFTSNRVAKFRDAKLTVRNAIAEHLGGGDAGMNTANQIMGSLLKGRGHESD